MVTPKQMHLDSAQISLNDQVTFRTRAGGFRALFTAQSPARYQTPRRHCRLRAPHSGAPGSGRVVSGAPWIQTRTSPDAPARTECVNAPRGIPRGADAHVRASVRALKEGLD